MGKRLLFGAMLAMLALAFADVGPGPAAPGITVTFVKGGVPFQGGVDLVYNCTFPIAGNDSSSPVGLRTVRLSCTGGVCTNTDGWFYKFNPCSYPPEGKFQYDIEGMDGHGNTGNIAFNESLNYRVEIDLDSGSVKKTTTRPGLCPLALAPVIGTLLYAGMKNMGEWT